MAIPVYDNANSVQGTALSVLTIPAFLVAGGSGTAIFVGVGTSAPVADLTTSVVRNGTETFTEIWDVVRQGGSYHNGGHGFQNPGNGSQSIVVTLGGTDDEVSAGAKAYTGTDASSAFGTPGTPTDGGSGAPTITVTAAADEMLVDVVYRGQTTLGSPGADQTTRWSQTSIGGFAACGGSEQPGTADDVMSWSGISTPWVLGAVPIRGPSTPPPPPMPAPVASFHRLMMPKQWLSG